MVSKQQICALIPVLKERVKLLRTPLPQQPLYRYAAGVGYV